MSRRLTNSNFNQGATFLRTTGTRRTLSDFHTYPAGTQDYISQLSEMGTDAELQGSVMILTGNHNMIISELPVAYRY